MSTKKKSTAWIFVIYKGIFSYIFLVNLENNNSTQQFLDSYVIRTKRNTIG